MVRNLRYWVVRYITVTVLSTSSRAVLHDEKTYPNPEAFDPTRFLTSDGQLNKDAPDPSEVMFGFGRRMCPGRYLALDMIFINTAYILATMDIKKSVDEHGNILEPSGEYSAGLATFVI